MPKIASESITRVCVRNLHTTRVGGSFACADFHVTPPFGSSILAEYPRQASLYVVVRRVDIQRLRSGRRAGDWLGVSWQRIALLCRGLIRKERGLWKVVSVVFVGQRWQWGGAEDVRGEGGAVVVVVVD